MKKFTLWNGVRLLLLDFDANSVFRWVLLVRWETYFEIQRVLQISPATATLKRFPFVVNDWETYCMMDEETIETWSEAVAILAVDALMHAALITKKDFDKAVGIVAEEIWVRLLTRDYPPQHDLDP